MARIRLLEISRFRGIKELSWRPSPGINCLVGPGDSGKSTILDAIDLCLGARRNVAFDDSDFYELDIASPIVISATLGELDDGLKRIETYGSFLRGFHAATGLLVDEPELGAEEVLTLRLTIGSDLEPVWALTSDRAEAQGLSRTLPWADRVRLAPTRIGSGGEYHLAWRRGSVLNRLAEQTPDASETLLKAAREARAAFGDEAAKELGDTLAAVSQTARELGVLVNGDVTAMLDADSVSFNGGTISLHDQLGVPMRALGTGSARLLIAGLQRAAASASAIVLVDELEYGLEPHRIIRLLTSLGSKLQPAPLQAFVTTHSPTALRELSGSQLYISHRGEAQHVLLNVGTDDATQSTVRLYPEAFLSRFVLVCEGASEVGFIRGIDRWQTETGAVSINAHSVSLIDANGADKCLSRALALQALGYFVAILRDADLPVSPELEKAS